MDIAVAKLLDSAADYAAVIRRGKKQRHFPVAMKNAVLHTPIGETTETDSPMPSGHDISYLA